MTTAVIGQKLLTADDLLRLYSEGVKGELVKGKLRETMASGGKHGEIAMALGAALLAHIRPHRLGRIAGSDSGVRLERDPDTVREPDLAYFSAATLPLEVEVHGYYEVVPDLVVEIISPSDRPGAVANRVAMWHRYGVAMVWAVYPATRTIAAHPWGGAAIVFGVDDMLDGGGVIPGFQCPARDLFDL